MINDFIQINPPGKECAPEARHICGPGSTPGNHKPQKKQGPSVVGGHQRPSVSSLSNFVVWSVTLGCGAISAVLTGCRQFVTGIDWLTGKAG